MTARDIRRPGWLGAPQQAVEVYGEAVIKGRQVPDPREAATHTVKWVVGLHAAVLVVNLALMVLIWRAC